MLSILKMTQIDLTKTYYIYYIVCKFKKPTRLVEGKIYHPMFIIITSWHMSSRQSIIIVCVIEMIK